MSAVATLLGLMLVVSIIAQFVGVQLPSDMRALEEQHQLTVENQVSRLQATVLAQIAHGPSPLSVGTPITLGSNPEPPFGTGATGSMAVASTGSQESVNVAVPVPPNWNHGNLCTTFSAGTCHNSQSNVCTPPLRYNESVNNASITFALTGSNDCTVLNFTGNGDTITLGVTGSNLGYFVLNLFGFNDTVVLSNQFSGSGFHAYFYLFGGYNTYRGSSGPTGSSLFLNTYFIGQSATTGSCPSGNLSATDSWSITGSSAGSSLQNLTWNNSAGYATPYHTTSGWPGVGNSGTGDHIGWKNVSTPTPCAFVKSQSYGVAWGGLSVATNNLYITPAVVAFDAGAVINAGPAGSVMLSPPAWHRPANGTSATPLNFVILTFVSGSVSSEAGRLTAAVVTHIISLSTATIATGSVAVSITTAYPQAWFTYLNSRLSGSLPGTTTCSGTAVTCVNPPPGTLVTVSTQFSVSSVTLTWAVVSMLID